ncbi:unnamed protein product [Peniophora sp. CBMAI 1063]|nr:unnamed protein product [Peniophora sp. CBMAI 1063]
MEYVEPIHRATIRFCVPSAVGQREPSGIRSTVIMQCSAPLEVRGVGQRRRRGLFCCARYMTAASVAFH